MISDTLNKASVLISQLPRNNAETLDLVISSFQDLPEGPITNDSTVIGLANEAAMIIDEIINDDAKRLDGSKRLLNILKELSFRVGEIKDEKMEERLKMEGYYTEKKKICEFFQDKIGNAKSSAELILLETAYSAAVKFLDRAYGI